MITELDVYRAAKKLLEEHGKQATLIAVDRADELRDRGDEGGWATWQRISRAIANITMSETEGPIN
ncbi:MAG: hypothetical protein HOE83_12600 [Alphaproteobacteria bacterium]|jgi:hypothetical protein|nr:hypothetical protein [Alphaproteobacteria bacterium]MBT4084614.1 hypothetical protein [Alphaproteobacteria bacterium]